MACAVLPLVAVVVCGGARVSAAQDARPPAVQGQTTNLFDGSSLDGWKGDQRFWSVANGAIVGQTTESVSTPHNTFLIWQGGEVGDFELELEFRLTAGNSGLQFRSVDQGEFRVSGYQADFDAGNRYTGIVYEENGRGILVPRSQHVMINAGGERTVSDEATCNEQAFLKTLQAGDWNQSRIVARGSQISNFVNGTLTARLDDGEAQKARASGIIALQLHAGPPMKVEFRNIRLTRFP